MLYSAIICILIVIFAIFSQIMTLKAVKFGFKIADRPEEAADEPVFNIPKKKFQPKMTEMDKRNTQILANIDRYDGTSRGQVKVEVKK